MAFLWTIPLLWDQETWMIKGGCSSQWRVFLDVLDNVWDLHICSILNCVTGWGFALLQDVKDGYFLANVFPFFTFTGLCLWTCDSFCHTEVRVCSMLSTGKNVQNLKLVKKDYSLTNDVFLLNEACPLIWTALLLTSCICEHFRIASVRIVPVLGSAFECIFFRPSSVQLSEVWHRPAVIGALGQLGNGWKGER